MYFPYLRGKQFELLAIQELIENKLLSTKVLPIIEPVKSATTLQKTIEIATKNNHKLIVIFNPEVGDVIDQKEKISADYIESVKSGSVYFGYITNQEMGQNLPAIIQENKLTDDKVVMIHLKSDYGDEYLQAINGVTPAYNIIPDQRSYSRKIKDNKVLLIDHFVSKKRNSEYANDPDEFFSDDHIYYKEEGYLGFGDYCTIGSKYLNGGFRPYAVAVHITYFDNDNILRIKHFVSKSNEDTADTPGKYYEALEKLIEWKKTANIETYALREFQKHYVNQTYPGLGTLKKLSTMHHIEIIDKFLSR